MSEKKSMTLEEHFGSIDGILKQMEQEDIGLEESFALYEAGLKEIKECSAMLDTVEKKMLVLKENGGTEEG